MEKINVEKWICSMIEAYPAYKEEGRIPCMYKQALADQGLEYRNGEIVKKRSEAKQEWNKEDEDILNTIINHFEIDLECTENDDIIRWLKSLRPQNHWKPSDEQMNALWDIISNDNLPNNEKEISQQVALTELYEQLKKLKGE